MNPPVSAPHSLEQLVSLARLGAEKAARHAPDPDEFNEVASFVGEQLETGNEVALIELEARLRDEDRRALVWYLTIVRTLSGTARFPDHFHHLLFIPVQAIGPDPRRLALGDATEEIAGALEHALDLGNGALQLSSEGVSLSTLESLRPLRWHALSRGKEDSTSLAGEFEELGAIVGRWKVAANDRVRLSRKLAHALQRTPSLNAWKMRTEGLLEERTPGVRVRLYPAVLLQDLFPLLRQVRLNTQLEHAARQCNHVRSLSWCWLEKPGELTWRLSCEGREPVSGSTAFPDESAELVEAQLARLAQRLQLKLSPPLP